MTMPLTYGLAALDATGCLIVIGGFVATIVILLVLSLFVPEDKNDRTL